MNNNAGGETKPWLAVGRTHRVRLEFKGEHGMNGAESLVRTLVKGGVEVCFANPGTSEMHFVGALDRVEGMRCVLGLFEGVCSGCLHRGNAPAGRRQPLAGGEAARRVAQVLVGAGEKNSRRTPC